MRNRFGVVVVVLAALGGCGPSDASECRFNSQCPSGHYCDDGTCVEGVCTTDAECVAMNGAGATCTAFGMCVGGTGGTDAGREDAGGADAGRDDAGTITDDASTGDAGGADDGGAIDDASAGGDAGGSDAGALFDPAASSAQIAAVRAASPGALSPALPVDGAVVTYVVPAIGADPAGFFVQAATTGPALFVAIDPATLTPPPAAGDVVALDVAETAVVSGQHRVTALDAGSYARLGTGAPAASLAQDVSTVDVVAMLDALESELVQASLTLTTDVTGPCGAGHACAQATSGGVPAASTMLRFRTLPSVVAARGLRSGCAIRVGPTPMWRFLADAQPSAFTAGEVTVSSCPAFRLLSASATAATTVVLTFDAAVDPASVTPTSFTLTGGATVSAASVAGTSITLTTSALTSGASYTVTVATSARDVGGTAISTTARAATFSYVTGSGTHLVINEVDYDSVGTDTSEFVEIFNPTSAGVSLAGHTLVLVNGSGGTSYSVIDLSSAGTLPAGGYLVIANATVSVAPGAIVRAWPGAMDQIQNGSPDGLALVAGGAIVDALSYEGEITAATVTGVAGTVSLVEGTATTAADNNATPASLARVPNGRDTDDASADWAISTAPTPGAPN